MNRSISRWKQSFIFPVSMQVWAVSLGFIFLCPDSVEAHWLYLLGAIVILGLTYVLFKMKYYHLHEEYLRGLQAK